MTFDTSWEKTYQNKQHYSRWPWSDFVSLFMRHYGSHGSTFNCLELGCGFGANIEFVRNKLGMYFGIDGSETAVNFLTELYFDDINVNIKLGDFVECTGFSVLFDVVIDRASLTHNSFSDVSKTIKQVRAEMADGGLFFSMNLFADSMLQDAIGVSNSDEFSMLNITTGPLAGLGMTTFWNENRIHKVFEGFDLLYLEKKTTTPIISRDTQTIQYYNLVAEKK